MVQLLSSCNFTVALLHSGVHMSLFVVFAFYIISYLVAP